MASKTNWKEILGWNTEQIEELRFSGFSYLREGLYEKALIFFEGLIILDPDNAYDNQTLGALYLQIGKKELALSTLDHALEIEPFHEPTLLNKAKALLLIGRKEDAFILIRNLEKSKDTAISGDASALVLAYS